MKKHHRHRGRKKRYVIPAEKRVYSNVLTKMIETYEPNREDWMGFKLSDDNPYTFHHIRERRFGGKEELENGAILTGRAHQFLNHLDCHHHKVYEEYQNIFRKINKNHGPITDDLLEDIYGMMLDVFYYNIYNINPNDLFYYEQFTNAQPKTLIKK